MKRPLISTVLLALVAACGNDEAGDDVTVLVDGPVTYDARVGGEVREGELESGRVRQTLDGAEIILDFQEGVLDTAPFPVAVSFIAVQGERTFGGQGTIPEVQRDNGAFEGTTTVDEVEASLRFQLPDDENAVVDVIRFEWVEPIDETSVRTITLFGRLQPSDVVIID